MGRKRSIRAVLGAAILGRTGLGSLCRRFGEYSAIYGATAAVLTRGSVAAAALLIFSSGATEPARSINCLALNIYFEARGEPEAGRRAVAYVVLNRVDDRRWPADPCAVIAQGWPQDGTRCQFSWYCDGRSDIPRAGASWRDAQRMAELVYWGDAKDPTGGAFWYHADYVSPRWSHYLRRGPKIGHHIFYYDPGPPRGSGKRPL